MDNAHYTMAELLAEEDARIKKEKELENQRKIEAEERKKVEKEQKHQAYLAQKEQNKQNWLKEQQQIYDEWEEELERRANTFEDKTLTCKKCGKEWIWTAKEQKFFKEKGFFKPSMCKDCRATIKTVKNFHKEDK